MHLLFWKLRYLERLEKLMIFGNIYKSVTVEKKNICIKHILLMIYEDENIK